MARTIDFDAFRREQKPEPFILTIGGKKYELAASLPAPLALDIIRLHDAEEEAKAAAEARGEKPKGMSVTPDQMMDIGAGLFGGEAAFRQVLSDGKVTLEELPELMREIIDAYTADVQGTDENPKAPEPTPTSL